MNFIHKTLLLWLSQRKLCFQDLQLIESQLLFHIRRELHNTNSQSWSNGCPVGNSCQGSGFRTRSRTRVFSAEKDAFSHNRVSCIFFSGALKLDVLLSKLLDLEKNRRWKILGKFSTPSIPTALVKTNTSWDLQLGLSIFVPLLEYLLPVRYKERSQRGTYLCLRPLDRLIVGQYRPRHGRWWIFQDFTFEFFSSSFINFWAMLNTFSILSNCVFL